MLRKKVDPQSRGGSHARHPLPTLAPPMRLHRGVLLGYSRVCLFIESGTAAEDIRAGRKSFDEVICGAKSEPGRSYCAQHPESWRRDGGR